MCQCSVQNATYPPLGGPGDLVRVAAEHHGGFIEPDTDTHITYGHTHQKARDPVRSPLDKLVRAGLVVGSVTTSEYPVL